MLVKCTAVCLKSSSESVTFVLIFWYCMFAGCIHLVFATARMPPAAVEGTDWSVLSRKAEGAGGRQEDHGQCGCGYCCPKKDDSCWGTTLNIYYNTARNRRCKCISELSVNASRALGRDSRKHYTSNSDSGHKASLGSIP